MFELIIAMLVAFFLYVFIINRRFGKLSSISASSYEWEGNKNAFFTLWLFLIAGLNIAAVADVLMGIGVLSSAGFLFAGVTLDHKNTPGKWPHTIGTVVAIVSPFVGAFLYYGIKIPGIVYGILCIIFWARDKRPIWYIENTGAVAVGVTYFMIYFAL